MLRTILGDIAIGMSDKPSPGAALTYQELHRYSLEFEYDFGRWDRASKGSASSKTALRKTVVEHLHDVRKMWSTFTSNPIASVKLADSEALSQAM